MTRKRNGRRCSPDLSPAKREGGKEKRDGVCRALGGRRREKKKKGMKQSSPPERGETRKRGDCSNAFRRFRRRKGGEKRGFLSLPALRHRSQEKKKKRGGKE